MEIKRDLYLQRIVDRMHNGMIKVITGIRRSGKSYLLFTIFKNYLISQNVPEDHIIAIELDMLENKRYRDPYVILDYIKSRITDEKDYYIFLDEVQLLEEFEEVLNSLLHIKLTGKTCISSPRPLNSVIISFDKNLELLPVT